MYKQVPHPRETRELRNKVYLLAGVLLVNILFNEQMKIPYIFVFPSVTGQQTDEIKLILGGKAPYHF